MSTRGSIEDSDRPRPAGVPPDEGGPKSGVVPLGAPGPASADGGQLLRRALGVLFELAERAGMPSSTTYRVVQGLGARGLVERQPGGGLALGAGLLGLARQVEDRLAATLVE